MRRGTSSARNGVAGVLAAVVAVGYLLTSGALDPVLQAAVTLALADENPTEVTPAFEAAPVADWQYFDDRPEWSTLRRVPAAPSRPDPPVNPARPVIAPPENPHRWRFFGPPPMPHYSLRPPGSCFQPRGPGHNAELLSAIPGTRSATVTWWDLGDPDTRSYQIAIVPVGATGNPVGYTDWSTVTEPVRFKTVAAPNTCKQINVRISNLKSGDAYRFWLTANNQSQVQSRMYRPVRGETQTVTVL